MGSIKDSTSNARHGDPVGVLSVTGQICKALQGDGADDHVDFPIVALGNAVTWSFSIKKSSTTDSLHDRIYGMPNFDFDMSGGPTGDGDLYLYNGSWIDTGIDLDQDLSVKIDVVREASNTWRHYKNGALVSSTSIGSGTITETSFSLFARDSGLEPLGCQLDEFRISSVGRDVDYILTNYNNENNDFLSLSNERSI